MREIIFVGVFVFVVPVALWILFCLLVCADAALEATRWKARPYYLGRDK